MMDDSKKTLDEVIAEEKLLAEAKVELEKAKVSPEQLEAEAQAMEAQDEIEASPVPNEVEEALDAQVESVEDVKPGEYFDLGPDDLGNIVSKEDVIQKSAEEVGDEIEELLDHMADLESEASDEGKPEAPISDDGEEAGGDESKLEPEDVTESAIEPEDVAEDVAEEPEAEPPKRKVNPRNTRR